MKEELLKSWKGRSRENIKKYKIFLNRIDKTKAIRILPVLHQEAFKKINCLDCAACCKNYSPRFKTPDIKRISKYLRMKEGDFIETYLKVDEDKDFVVKTAPCPFLGDDNHCMVYEARPKACREYPHTDRKKMVQIMDLTYKNTLVCPAVLEMVERLKKI